MHFNNANELTHQKLTRSSNDPAVIEIIHIDASITIVSIF